MIHFKRKMSGARQSLSISPARYGRLLAALAALVILALPASLMAQDTGKADQWQFVIEPYLWLPAIDVATTNGSDFKLDLDNVVSGLQFAFMGVVGVQKGKWSFMVDTVYADVKATKDSSMSVLNSTINFQTEVEVKAWVVTPVIGYNLIDCGKGKLDIVAGARYLDVEVDASVNSDRARARNTEFSVSDYMWDGIVGVKGEITLYEQLYMPLYLDIGTGNSDFTWQVAGGLGYRFGLCDLVAGYRYLSWDLKNSSPVKDMNLSGPYIAVKFMF
jgi:hypothetical protein